MLDPCSQEKKDISNNNKVYINRLIPYNSAKMKNQHKIIINNIEIFFPFSPHEIQIIYIKKILYNLNQKFLLKEKYKAIAALESPIGTGKTLCLLCSTLAWINDMRRTNSFKGKIIYATNNYNKISHIIKELNKTYYKPKISTLFSPYNACVNDQINNSKNDKIVYIKCKKNYYNCEFFINNNNDNIDDINEKNENNDNYYNNKDYMDIEELAEYVCNKKLCPFYKEKKSANNSDIIFMPYDFLFNKDFKKILDINIDNNILIIDESHNLSKLCQDINSISISTEDLEDIIQDLYQFIETKNIQNEIIEINDINCEILCINRIINNINNNKYNILQGEVFPDKGLLLTSKEFLSLFLIKNSISNENGTLEYISLDNINKHISFLKKIQKLIYVHFEKNTKLSLYISILEKINNFYINQNDYYIDSYSFFLSYAKSNNELNNIKNKNNNLPQIRKLNIYCFDPSLSFKELINEKPYAVFLSSDTLAPFDILENEFKLKFDVKLENEHIVDNEQFKFSIIKSSLYNSEKIVFQLDYIHRSNVKMIITLGYTLLSLCHANQNGSILVYFPSMTYLNQCYLIWKDNKINDSLQEINNIYYSQKHLKKLKKLKNDKNYIFFVVFDKNTSPEEKFFRETKISMVVCMGIPYDTEYSFDDKIQLKIKYLDDKIKKKLSNNNNQNSINYNNKKKDELNGEKWYEKNSIYIINRFLGKTLKFLSGYGSLICIDERYESALNNGFFSSYLKNNCEVINIENSKYFQSLQDFFEKIKNDKYNGFNFFNNNTDIYNIIEEKKSKNFICDENDEQSENYYFNKKYKNKIFYLTEKQENPILKELGLNNSIKLEELKLNSNKYLNNANIIPFIDKNKNDFLQKKKNKNKDNNNISDDDENNNKNKKIKTEENKINDNGFNFNFYNYNYDGNNIFQHFCQEYDSNNNNNVNNNNGININSNNRKNDEEEKKKSNIKNNENINEDNETNMNGDLEFEANPEILEQLNNNTYTMTTQKVYECPICFKMSDKYPDLIYSISKCKHVLCNNCWSGWLTEKLECPLCKSKARAKTLKRLIFI